MNRSFLEHDVVCFVPKKKLIAIGITTSPVQNNYESGNEMQ